ncbi:MAG: hypothetical protein AABW73_01525 [Nanoarchaeota archaeon]
MKGKINKLVVFNSIIALGCLALTFFVHWLFIIPAVYLMIRNQKELVKN